MKKKTQSQLNNAIQQRLKHIKKLKSQVNELYEQFMVTSGRLYRFEENEETFGRGKSKITELIGRVYWKEDFKDEDSDTVLTIERSRIVRRNGVFTETYF